jgi:tRNA1Val (adenine37-N6)-methyltransferase
MAKKLLFKFKQFDCAHELSSMRIGVDAVLLGAWAGDNHAHNILDVGTGCGVIALMLAQRNAEANILGIDIDRASIEEATYNFQSSPWSSRIKGMRKDFNEIANDHVRYDLIVSNPPYFDSGVKDLITRREIARHQGTLSPTELVAKSGKILADDGRLAIVIPIEQKEALIKYANESDLKVLRILDIQGNKRKSAKRSLVEFIHSSKEPTASYDLLVLEDMPGVPTAEHIALCKDFYLKW